MRPPPVAESREQWFFRSRPIGGAPVSGAPGIGCGKAGGGRA